MKRYPLIRSILTLSETTIKKFLIQFFHRSKKSKKNSRPRGQELRVQSLIQSLEWIRMLSMTIGLSQMIRRNFSSASLSASRMSIFTIYLFND